MPTVRFENTEEDAIVWNLYRVFQTPMARRQYLIQQGVLILFASLCVSAYFFLTLARHGLLLPTLISLGVFLLYALIAFATRRSTVIRQTRIWVRRGLFKNFLGPATLSLQRDGLHTDWSEGSLIRKWSAFQRFAETDSHLILHWGDNDFSMVPKRAFANPEAQQAFMAEVERLRNGAAAITSVDQTPPTETKAAWYRDRHSTEAESQKVHNRLGGGPL